MDFLEEKTSLFLNSLGLGEVKFEPLGRDTFPDFSIGNKIAVECTKLVKAIEGVTLETVSTSQMQSLENALKTVKRYSFEKSYFVSVRYRISFDVRLMTKVISDYLNKCVSTGFVLPEQIKLADGLSVSFTASSPREQPFSLGSVVIENSGGWLMEGIEQQCREAIFRKSSKAIKHREVFSDFWLAVGSALTIGIGTQEIQFIGDEIGSIGLWSHLLLIDAASPMQSQLIRLTG